MPAIVASIEIDRPPVDVFRYAVDPAHLAAWQENVVSAHSEEGGELRVGSRVITTRQVGPREQAMTMEMTAYDEPRGWSMRGVDGPVRALVDTRIEPLEDGGRSRVTIELDFVGHGIGKLMVPLLVRPQTRSGLPRNLSLLKETVEARH
jgi:uncharacterized protein YndB with AHSA1/START domain